MGEPVVRRPSSETGTRNGVKQKTEADPTSMMVENNHLISTMPEPRRVYRMLTPPKP